MSSLVVRINAGVNFIADLIGYTVRINYFLGETLFTFLSWAFANVSTGTRTLLTIIKVALFDFGQFVEDISKGFTSFIAFLELVVNLCGQFVYNIFFAFLSALASFVSVVIGVFTSVYATISAIIAVFGHLLEVGGRSLVLLLQTLPSSIVSGLKCILDGILERATAFIDSIVNGCKTIGSTLIAHCDNVRNIVKGLPGEAYLGTILLLLIVMAFHYAIVSMITHRVIIGRKCYDILLRKIPLFITHHGRSLLAMLRSDDVVNEIHEDSSPSSSFESPPSPYNLRQRKPGQKSVRTSRIESIKLQLQQEKESRLCVICADHNRSVVLLPCRHFSFCDVCVSQVIKYQQYCPVCRQEIDEVVSVYQ